MKNLVVRLRQYKKLPRKIPFLYNLKTTLCGLFFWLLPIGLYYPASIFAVSNKNLRSFPISLRFLPSQFPIK